jgi:hypothetical protein
VVTASLDTAISAVRLRIRARNDSLFANAKITENHVQNVFHVDTAKQPA